MGGTAPVVLNAANEEAVAAFLEGAIRFTQISLIIEAVMSKIPCEPAASLAIIQKIDKQARTLSKELIIKDFH
jgi:1-deoxy-D-xylulose-5-phosphate reductoisomerase